MKAKFKMIINRSIIEILIIFIFNTVDKILFVNGVENLKLNSTDNEDGRGNATISWQWKELSNWSCAKLKYVKAEKPTILARPASNSIYNGNGLSRSLSSSSTKLRISCTANYPIVLYVQRNFTKFIALNSVISIRWNNSQELFLESIEIPASLNQAKYLFKCAPKGCSEKRYQSNFETSFRSGDDLKNYASAFNETTKMKLLKIEKDVAKRIVYFSMLGSTVLLLSVLLLLLRLLCKNEWPSSNPIKDGV